MLEPPTSSAQTRQGRFATRFVFVSTTHRRGWLHACSLLGRSPIVSFTSITLRM
jgi:hypothetical protein